VVMISSIPIILAYFSPDTFLPMTSIIASAVGCVLLFGRSALRLVLGAFRVVTARRSRSDAIPRPHFRFADESAEANPELQPEGHDASGAPQAAKRSA
jgi:hypothetical protein